MISQYRLANSWQRVGSFQRNNQEVGACFFNGSFQLGFLLNLADNLNVRLIGNRGGHQFTDQPWSIRDEHSDGAHKDPPQSREYLRSSMGMDADKRKIQLGFTQAYQLKFTRKSADAGTVPRRNRQRTG
jgi:hypothetical protein